MDFILAAAAECVIITHLAGGGEAICVWGNEKRGYKFKARARGGKVNRGRAHFLSSHLALAFVRNLISIVLVHLGFRAEFIFMTSKRESASRAQNFTAHC